MPKIVDNYVLERKIGSGQFGDVFKGYNKITNQDIAIKCVKRASLKGKFHELLENEIRVLRTCNNDNIIKLYDIKKTSNNFYLMLEYCNEGDLMQYIKEKKTLTEDESIEFLIQILNAFKTLVKNKIMHRDFKLANILKHDGNIKIADFGFSKLLGNEDMTQTMLGSPLNMAPEVLNGLEYSNKADIWSIGTVFYELLFGKPPFTATNMIELIKTIQNKQLDIPRKINNVSQVTEDVLRKMLVVDPKRRIEWDDLFNHPICNYLEDKIKKDLADTLHCDDGQLQMNMSKFYIKNNKVISHPSEINKKEDLNNYAANVMKQGGQQKGQYSGAVIKRKVEREEDQKQDDDQQQNQQTQQNSQQSTQQDEGNQNDDQLSTEESVREMQIRIKKKNANRVLHERNIYVFLASVAEDAMNNTNLKNSDIVGFLLVKKLLQLVDYLATKMKQKQNIYNLDIWDLFVNSKDFKDIFAYIEKEYDVFRMYFQSMYDRLSQNPRIKNMNLDEETRVALSSNIQQSIDKVMKRFLKEYSIELVQFISSQKGNNPEVQKQLWIHADRILDCYNMDTVFQFEDSQKQLFNFKSYYDEDEKMEINVLIAKVEKKIKTL